MQFNKLTLANLNGKEEAFNSLMQQISYNTMLRLTNKFLAFIIEQPVVVFSSDSSFFYIEADSADQDFCKKKIKFAFINEFVILHGPVCIIAKDNMTSAVNIRGQKDPIFLQSSNLSAQFTSRLDDYIANYNDYYLGYDKRYAKVYNSGGTTWEATAPNDSLMTVFSKFPNYFNNKRVIDLGCGEGRDTLFLSQQGVDVIGVDISPAALAKARELAEYKNINAKFIELNVLYLNGLPDNKFDTAINMGCLHMIVDFEERLNHIRNVYRILTEGGIFIIDHCQENWGKGFFSLPEYLYNKDKLVHGNIIDRRIRTKEGERLLPLEVIPYAERKDDEITNEVCSVGFTKRYTLLTDTEAFGNSALIVFEK